MNSRGDFIIAGNWSALAFIQGTYRRLHYKRNISKDIYFSSGISQGGEAIICADGFAFKHSSGLFQQVIDIKSDQRHDSGRLRCTMTADGDWAAVDISTGRVYINHKKAKINLSTDLGWLSTLGPDFVYMTRGGEITIFDKNGIIKQSIESKFKYLEDNFRIAGSERQLILVDDFNTALINFNNNKQSIESILPIYISPIEDGQAASLSWSNDTWSIGGSWGLWLGKDTKYKRLFPLVSSPKAFAFSMEKDSFVMLGDSDGDLGPLKELMKHREKSPRGELKVPEPIATSRKYQKQWWYESAGLLSYDREVNTTEISHSEVSIAVIDTGADNSQYKSKRTSIFNENDPINGFDDDKNGIIDDYYGYDFVMDRAEPQDRHGHGSHVYGLATESPFIWLKGIPIRALDQGGKSNSIDLSRAIDYAVSREVDIINCSWGGGRPTIALKNAIARATAAGILVISSSGNDGLNVDGKLPVPSSFPQVVSIGAIDRRGNKASFSNWGSESIAYMAPGKDVVSHQIGGGKRSMSGTSMAAPIASNVFARLLAYLKSNHVHLNKKERLNVALDASCQYNQARFSRCSSIHAYQSLMNL